jgi:hypothetical protein
VLVLANELIGISLEASVKRVLKEQANPPGVERSVEDIENSQVSEHAH